MGNRRAHIEVFGKVQGVCYRYYTVEKATALNITGFIRNRMDGSVEIVAEGEEANIRDLIQWANQGSPASNVSDVRVDWEEYKGEFKNFTVKF